MEIDETWHRQWSPDLYNLCISLPLYIILDFNSLRPSDAYTRQWAIIDSENDLSPSQRLAIIWPNAGTLRIGLLGTNFSEILIEIHKFSFKKMHLANGGHCVSASMC